MKKLNLPRGYLSFSSMSLWQRSRETFRNRYYTEDPDILDTVYTRFGKYIAEKLEDRDAVAHDPILSKIPIYEISEQEIQIEIDGVPIKAYLDSYDPVGYRILEYKTGVRKRDGSAPWDQVKVRKHDQLRLYSLLVKEQFGEVDPITTLVWMETEFQKTFKPKSGLHQETYGPELQLTGHFEIFEREIEDWEHLHMRQLIRKIAEEISEDYERYQNTESRQQVYERDGKQKVERHAGGKSRKKGVPKKGKRVGKKGGRNKVGQKKAGLK